MFNPRYSIPLVWLSLIMLGAFLIYWNTNQYQIEKQELEQDLNDQMRLAFSAYNDSLFSSIISIVEMDTSGMKSVKVHADMRNSDSISNMIIDKVSQVDTNISIMISQKSIDFKGVDSSDVFENQTLPKNLIHSMVGDSAGFSMSHTSSFSNQLKEERFEIFIEEGQNNIHRIKHFFDGNLKNQGLPNRYKVSQKETASQGSKASILIPIKGFSVASNQSYASFENYQSYIFSKLTSSITMSSLLFSIVALAFYFIVKVWKEQEHLVKIKSEFISNMTHELKTPISTVGVAIEALSDYGALNDQKRREEYLNISKHELNRLSILVDKVLQMSSIEDNVNALQFEQLDLKEITDQMLHSMKLPFEKNKVKLDYDSSGKNFDIQGDRVHMTNVLYNLIDNAIKYSKDDPVIEIQIAEQSQNVSFEIKDRGIGISKQYQDKVFDRFFRVPTGDVHNVKGHGVGLNYVSDVIKQHNGELSMRSEEGVGTSFIFKIPKIS